MRSRRRTGLIARLLRRRYAAAALYGRLGEMGHCDDRASVEEWGHCSLDGGGDD